ncbi:MAG: NAD(P)H-hydrate epimerase [Lachnospiraceae bacterium]|nr:NAD(P)H-hydrate epimerase [Lachnospiraceae bacterium]
MNIVTVSEMKEIERLANESLLSYYCMMENAGNRSYELIISEYPETNSLIIFCGKGNNGGDGLVVARLAANDHKKVHIILVEGIPVTEDALTNYNKLPDSVEISHINEIDEKIIDMISDKTVIVDALYGTGFHGELREEGKKACNIINSINCPIISLDIPSGINADTGFPCQDAVKATITVVFHAYKNAHIKTQICGQCKLVDIGIDKNKI